MTYDFNGDDDAGDDSGRWWEETVASPEIDEDDLEQLRWGDMGESVEAKFDVFLERITKLNLTPEQRSKWIAAWRKLHVIAIGDDEHFTVKPDALHDPAPKAATGFPVTSTRRRLSKDQIAKRGRLLKIVTEIKGTKDSASIGRLLKTAKDDVLQHGEFSDWLNTIPMEQRTAQRYMAAA